MVNTKYSGRNQQIGYQCCQIKFYGSSSKSVSDLGRVLLRLGLGVELPMAPSFGKDLASLDLSNGDPFPWLVEGDSASRSKMYIVVDTIIVNVTSFSF